MRAKRGLTDDLARLSDFTGEEMGALGERE